jgi:hypothetical protein
MESVRQLDQTDIGKLTPSEINQLRRELYAAAQHHEAQAAKYWRAYWQTMGLTHRPLTVEQIANQSVTKLKSVSPPKPRQTKKYETVTI